MRPCGCWKSGWARAARCRAARSIGLLREVISAAGYGAAFTHRTGHSIGWQGAHGDGVNIDDFETHDTRLLRRARPSRSSRASYLATFGVRSEINVAITAGGQVKVTTPPQVELVRLVL